jgi:protein MpaA
VFGVVLILLAGCGYSTTKIANREIRPDAPSAASGMGRTPTSSSQHVSPHADRQSRWHPYAKRRIGTSVQGRPLLAYRLGDRRHGITAVLVGSMHGNEPAGVRLVEAIRSHLRVRAVDIWVVPTINPDGVAADTRQNAHGVDLNRNWAYRWQRQAGQYDSGTKPFSEPETRAMRRFLNLIDARFVVSFHQPLHGVDSDAAKNRRLLNRLATNLHLPKKPMRCNGVCHGTMTGWYNAHHSGAAITVELGPRPPLRYLTGRGARGTVRSVLGHY